MRTDRFLWLFIISIYFVYYRWCWCWCCLAAAAHIWFCVLRFVWPLLLLSLTCCCKCISSLSGTTMLFFCRSIRMMFTFVTLADFAHRCLSWCRSTYLPLIYVSAQKVYTRSRSLVHLLAWLERTWNIWSRSQFKVSLNQNNVVSDHWSKLKCVLMVGATVDTHMIRNSTQHDTTCSTHTHTQHNCGMFIVSFPFLRIVCILSTDICSPGEFLINVLHRFDVTNNQHQRDMLLIQFVHFIMISSWLCVAFYPSKDHLLLFAKSWFIS